MEDSVNKETILKEIFNDAFEKVALSEPLMERTLIGASKDMAKRINLDVINPATMKLISEGIKNRPKSGFAHVDRAALHTATSTALSSRRNVLKTVKGVSNDSLKSVGANTYNIVKGTKGIRHITKIPGVKTVIKKGIPFGTKSAYKIYASKPVRKLIENKVTTGHVFPKAYKALSSIKGKASAAKAILKAMKTVK